MQIQKIKSNEAFGIMPMPIHVASAPTPAIIKECSGWLANGRNSINYIREAGITLKKGKKSIDIYDEGILIGNMPKPATPKSVEKFVKFLQELREEFAEYTDSRIKLVGPNGTQNMSEPIITRKLKGPGRINIDKSTTRKQSI